MMMLRAFILKEMFCEGNVFLKAPFVELTFRFCLEIVQTLCDFLFYFFQLGVGFTLAA